jgi:transcriptional regulator with XRE-family HTH domain
MKETLSQYLNRLMKQKDWGVRDLERNSGNRITNSHISKILKGKANNLMSDKIVALAEGLNVDPHEVFSVISGRPVADAEELTNVAVFADLMQKMAVNPVLLEIMQELLRMPANHQRQWLESLKFANERPKKERKKKQKRR